MLRAIGELFGGIGRGLRAEANPNDERMWSQDGMMLASATGLYVTPTLAFQVSCWFQGCRLIAETLGTLPLKFVREEGEAHEQLRDYWLRPVLSTRKGRANEWMSAQAWREMMVMYATSWGRGCSEIVPGSPLSLLPLDPSTTRVEQQPDRTLRFGVTRTGGGQDWILQERVFRLDGVAIHPLVPFNLLSLARETLALWAAAEQYNALYFRQGARPSLFLEHPGKPSETVLKDLAEKVKKWQGLANMHRIFIGEQGMKPHTLGWSAKDSLLPEQKQEIACDIARWLNIPEHMFRVGKQPTFASIEQFAREFVDYTLLPWIVRMEGALNDLIPEPEIYVEHNLNALLRGSLLDRCQAYASGIMNGWLAENEARAKEGLNPVPGLDQPRRSVNQDRGREPGANDDPPQPVPPRRRRRDDDEEEGLARAPRRLALIVRGNAERVVHRELAAVQREAAKLAGDPEAWVAWLGAYYAEHARYVADALQLEPALAREYAERHRAALAAAGLATAAAWGADAVAELVALTLEEASDAA